MKGINATFDNTFPIKGNLALVTQSGAISAGILDWAANNKIGFSTVVSLGNSADIDFADILDYLTADTKTQCILLYIEGIHHARRFMSALRAATRLKPVVVIKAGRNKSCARTAISYTSTLIGDDDVFDIALHRAGAVRVMTIEELFLAAQVLASHYRLKSNRIAVITNSGALGIMAADRAADLKMPLPELSAMTRTALDPILPTQWSHQNPIDIIGDASPRRYREVLEVCIADDNIDGILAILAPVALTKPIKVAEEMIAVTKKSSKPIFASWVGKHQVKSSRKLFATHHIPYFETPEKAIQAFSYLVTYQNNQKLLLQVPDPLSPQKKPDLFVASMLIKKVLEEQRTQLTNNEVIAFLQAFTIPSPAMQTNIFTEKLVIKVKKDVVFGPVISLALEYALTHNNKTRALALPPLNSFIAKQLIEQMDLIIPAHSYQKIVNMLLSVSEMICEISAIKEMTIDLCLSKDAEISVTNAEIGIVAEKPTLNRYAHMAIHPYPNQLIKTLALSDESKITVRPIRPEDALMTQELVRGLSSQSKYFRFMQHIRELTFDTLVQLTQIDYDREMTFIATIGENEAEKGVGLAHYVTNIDRESCEFAIVIADDWQNKGIGSKLMKALTKVAQAQLLSVMRGFVIATNTSMLELTQRLGFIVSNSDDPTVKIVTRHL
jgi:acetyltransferase